MDAARVERLKRYIATVTHSRDGWEGALEYLTSQEKARSPFESLPNDQMLRLSARSSVEALSLGHVPRPDQLSSLEAIIDAELRPAIDIVNGSFTVSHPLWADLSDRPFRTRIESVMPSIGRIELPGHRRLPYGGTGFVVGRGIVMTNRHVAEIFARGLGDRKVVFLPEASAGIDFLHERDQVRGATLMVSRVIMIHPYWDMAILAVDGLPSTALPLTLSLRDARDLVGHRIFVVGYPAFDPRNPERVQNDVFGGRYGIKRLQPGELQGGLQTASFGKLVYSASHDCSTLGGNSGSAVIDLENGEVLGLHFGGAYHQMNYSVPSAALAQDSRVTDSGVCFSSSPPGEPNTWGEWWKRADSDESPDFDPTTDLRPTDVPLGNTFVATANAPASIKRLASGELSLQVPLTITISLGAPAHPEALDSAEAVREPFHDGEYSSRTGFDSSFLGSDSTYDVPLPQPHDLSVLAPTRDGDTLLHYENFSIAMHAKRRLALFTASNIARETHLRRPEAGRDYTRQGLSGLGSGAERWFIDPRMDDRYQLPDSFFTKDRKAFDKGHIVRREDVAWGSSYEILRRANGDTYHVTNCSPQVAGFNQASRGFDNWGDLENKVFSSAASERLSVLAGPVLSGNDQIFFGVGDGGQSVRAKVPTRFWKIIIAPTDDGLAAFGFVLDQDLADVQWTEFVVPANFVTAMVSIVDIEEMTGIVFGEALRNGDQYGTLAGTELAFRSGLR